MPIIILGSVVGISLVALLIRTKLKQAWICPICVGTLLTWVWLLAARFTGYTIDSTILALLMGGSVVGAVFTFEKKLPVGRSGITWKMSAVPFGFVLAYTIVSQQWSIAAGAVVIALALVYYFFRSKGASAGRLVEATALEEKMKQCC